jgi:colanic acid/amylovoran biosynthesis glycosyltransferase
MPTIAYLANQYPSPVEPYVTREIMELRRCGVDVIPCTAWHAAPTSDPQQTLLAREALCLLSWRVGVVVQAAEKLVSHLPTVWTFIARALFRGSESPWRRLKAIGHTLLGIYYAQLLERTGVQHIHVHHGYFSAWVAMVAARLLGITYSITLHGSDLLLHDAYLDTKLENCSTCFTVSEYNRKYALQHFPHLNPGRIVVQRMGVDCCLEPCPNRSAADPEAPFLILSVGRLHPVKDFAFLINACSCLKERGLSFACLIAGEGRERLRLERQIADLGLKREVRLLGHVDRAKVYELYRLVDLVVLTSRSEGLPLTLMEAMSRGRVVLAPNITGIPELVVPGKTGFLYTAGSLTDFVAQVEKIQNDLSRLTVVQKNARQHVHTFFDQTTNLKNFISVLLSQISPVSEHADAHSVLQQI